VEAPDLQPTLIGPRIVIRPIKPADWPEMFAAASDPEIWALHPARDRYKEPVFRAFFDGALALGSAFSFVEKESGKIIGSSRYYAHNPAASEIEIGWTFLARPYWGGSYNREIKRLMLEHAFSFVDTVVFWVGETNWRSQRAMEKIGGVKRPELERRPVDPTPHVVFEIRKSDFRSSPFWT
jgi:RimJ/RimL family protein N-acetyltransferase